jgi:parallel beta-helix repeat protein
MGCTLAWGQGLGAAPSSAPVVTDLYSAFRLPPLRDSADGALHSALTNTQVGVRAALLGLNGTSPLDAWSAAAVLVQGIPAGVAAAPGTLVTFVGTRASELNKLLAADGAAILVTSPALEIDTPLELRRSGTMLDLGNSVLTSDGAPYMLRIEAASRITVRGGVFVSGTAGILINSAQQVRVESVEMQGLASHGIVVTGSTGVVLSGNRFRGISGAPVLLHRGTSQSVVERNDIAGGLGPSNMTAGIVLSDREVDLAESPSAIFSSDGYWVVSQPITDRLHPPHDNVVIYNHVAQNASSGVYVDGGVRNIVVSNTIENNSKEGICLDNGSTANVVASNVIERNGDRWGEPDWVLARDSVLGGGRLPDGTAAAKVPGISIDNAMYNVVFQNNVSHNFGGGIKIVRTGYFNLIGLNTVFSNNDGASDSFHFFGIELGSANEDSASVELNFTPSRGNVVFSNPIRGSHYSGIFFAPGSDQNDVFDNTILDATHWALESVIVMANSSLNNLTNLPSHNIGSGIDPSLLTTGKPVLDPASK